jgi:hypothetical protein
VGASGDDGRKLFQHVGHRGPVYKGPGAMNPCDNLLSTPLFYHVSSFIHSFIHSFIAAVAHLIVGPYPLTKPVLSSI